MDDLARLAALLIGPATLAIFGLGFVWAWLIERSRPYLLLMAGACMCFVIGALAQMFRLPADAGLNALVSNLFYTSSVLLVAEGLLRRSKKRFGITIDLGVLAVFCVLIWYFYYIDRNLQARIYI